MLIKWAKRRHPSKGIEWAVPRYFGRIKGDKWVFKATSENRQGNKIIKYIFRLATIPIVRHIKVTEDATPDDPNLKEYWEKRKTRIGKNYFAKDSKLYRIAEKQKWKCPICKENLFNQELIETHHLKEVADGGTNEEDNLIHVHQQCHRQIHGRRAKVQIT
jgi:RNA-directed DNA polymerase